MPILAGNLLMNDHGTRMLVYRTLLDAGDPTDRSIFLAFQPVPKTAVCQYDPGPNGDR
jgi:hypothetical protein